jgi:hypothetical protein
VTYGQLLCGDPCVADADREPNAADRCMRGKCFLSGGGVWPRYMAGHSGRAENQSIAKGMRNGFHSSVNLFSTSGTSVKSP